MVMILPLLSVMMAMTVLVIITDEFYCRAVS